MIPTIDLARPADAVAGEIDGPHRATERACQSLRMQIGQVAQHADDLDRAEAFYAKLLGPPAGRFDPPGLLFFRLGDTRLLLERGAPSALFYLRVDDVRATVEQLRIDGVTIEGEPHVIFHHDDDRLGPTGYDEWMAFFRDSEGNVVGLVSHHLPA